MRILLLSKYGRKGASSRLRSFQFLPYLESRGLKIDVSPLFEDWYIEQLYGNSVSRMSVFGAYFRRVEVLLHSRQYDLIWIEKEALPWLPFFVERLLLSGKVPYVLDFDDAIFHRYDLNKISLVRKSLGRKIDRLMSASALVTAGNSYLAQRAIDAGARVVVQIPTVVDTDRYEVKKWGEFSGRNVVGWIGSPSTAKYIRSLDSVFLKLNEAFACDFRAVGANSTQLIGTNIEAVKWSESSEVRSICGFDIGVMPLIDEPFERGKCGYKLIQYMACGVPVVGSPVGVNQEIVRPGVNGFLAGDDSEWEEKLKFLLGDCELRKAMGLAGRSIVENEYSLKNVAPVLYDSLVRAAV